MIHTNIHNLPGPLVTALSNDIYVKAGHISVTGLIQPPRIRQLMHRHKEKITEDVSDKIWMLLGSAVHSVLERAETANSLQEERLSAQVLGWKVSGMADLYEDPGVLSDFKITSVWSGINGVKPDWEAQINLYAHLYRQAGFEVSRGQIVCIYRDWQKNRAKQGGNYPQCAAGVLPVNLWPQAQAQDYLEYRVKLHQLSEEMTDNALPECTAEERWERPTTYAVMKQGRKSAIRVLDTAEDAYSYLGDNTPNDKNHYIETRPGQSIRCDDYCPVNTYCNQYQEARNAN